MKQKVEAIFDLREAAEAHALARLAVDQFPTPSRKDDLLEAKLTLEEATQDAIDACEHCALPHAKDAPCSVVDFPSPKTGRRATT
jgi:hypothetical protein